MSNFRTWWLPPRRAGEPTDHRSVGPLELLFDVVFVVLIARLARRLSVDPGKLEIARTGLLLVPVWSVWVSGALFHDLHGLNDISTRVFTFAQMIAVAGMAVYVASAAEEGGAGFALSYAFHHLVLAVMWYRTVRHDPEYRPASVPFAAVYAVSALLFLVSAGVASPARFVLWGVALLLEILTVTSVGRLVPDAAGLRTHGLSIPVVERFGSLVMLVLGGVAIGAIDGVSANGHLGREVLFTGLEAIVVACGLAWIYFDFVSRLRPVPARSAVWANLHFFVIAGMAGVWAAVVAAVRHADEAFPPRVHWLLVGSMALTFVALAGLMAVLEIRQARRQEYDRGIALLLAIAFVSVLTGTLDIGQSRSLLIGVALLAIPIGYGMMTWGKLREGSEIVE